MLEHCRNAATSCCILISNGFQLTSSSLSPQYLEAPRLPSFRFMMVLRKGISAAPLHALRGLSHLF